MRCFVHFDFQNVLFATAACNFFDIWTDKSGPNMRCFVHFDFQNVLFATAACNFSTSEQTKVLRSRHVLYILTFKCAFRHSGVQFFDILNRQKCSEAVMFCTFWLSNVLFATAACNFWFRLWALTSAPAALTGLLFDWPNRRIIEKTQAFRDFSNIWRGCIFLSSDFRHYCIFCRLTWRLYCWAMHLLFNSPYCRKFLFKLPSIIYSIQSNAVFVNAEYQWAMWEAPLSCLSERNYSSGTVI